jgi:PAS domain-containing protein
MDQTFRAVAETVTDAVISADRHGDITYINRGG